MKTYKLLLWSAFLLVGLFGSIVAGLVMGSVDISLTNAWTVILQKMNILSLERTGTIAQSTRSIIWNLRFPRIVLAALVGAGLSVVGCALQALVRNPLADPYILGISSGASVGAALVIVLGVLSTLGQWALSVAACLGAFGTLIAVFVLARQGNRLPVVRLLLAGIAMSAILSAVTSFILFVAPRESGVSQVIFWIMGSLSGATWNSLPLPLAVVLTGTVLLILRARSLNIMLLGDESARGLGLDVNRFRKFLLVVSTVMTGVLVAVSGVIGFVGLIMPHVVRILAGSDHFSVVPLSALGGSIFLIWMDVMSRTIMAPEELPIGILTALLGGPFFIFLMRQRTYRFGEGTN